MKTFLEYVADDIISKYGTDLSKIAVVFPNKRASLFLNKYLMQIAQKPIWSPRYITISDLFRSQSTLTVADPIKAISMLYRIYSDHVDSTITIDNFWGWGEIMLEDFDDIDKNMGDARLIFSNVSALHAFDSVDYLDEEKRKILQQFFAEFSDSHDSKLKKRFEKLWNQLGTIYEEFRNALFSENLTYEGALYRDVAEQAESMNWQYDKYLFVGFNMLQAAEQSLFKSLRSLGKASFYWDFDNYYRDGDRQEAGRFIDRCLAKFPNELDSLDEDIYDNLSKEKDISFLTASSENIQARYIHQWLSQNDRIKDGEKTAIVLADESLLKSVIHYIPQDVAGKANITIGYPLYQAPITAFVENFLSLHLHGYNATRQVFTQKFVNYMLMHPYMRMLSDSAAATAEQLQKDRIYYPKASDLCNDEGLSMIFHPIDESRSEMNTILLTRLKSILKTLGEKSEQQRILNINTDGKDPDTATSTFEEQFTQESIFRMYNIINRLSDLVVKDSLQADPTTLARLLDQIVRQTSMPLHGEPAIGIQIMGMLETRNLDFKHVLILSCNEGNLPKGLSQSSLIPYSVRKAYDLTTVDNKVAIYAYYFYRLLQRSTDIAIAYNCSTEDGQTGQMSRFMTQLMAETDNSSTHIRHYALSARQQPADSTFKEVEKTPEMMERLSQRDYLSPSAINSYLRCQLTFYYKHIIGIREPDSDDIDDNRLFGNIFHKAAELIYRDIADPQGIITSNAIKNILSDKGRIGIYRYVDEAFSEELFAGRRPEYDGLQLINREAIYLYIQKLLRADSDITPFQIVGLEEKAYEKIIINAGGTKRELVIGGIIDRLDRVRRPNGTETLRVVDYKTGASLPKPMASVHDIFDTASIKKHSDYYLQTMLYASIVSRSAQPFSHNDRTSKALNTGGHPVIPFLFFIQKKDSNKEKVLYFYNNSTRTDIEDIKDFDGEFRQELTTLLEEIFDPSTSFMPTEFAERCDRCAFLSLCRSKA